MKNTKNKILFLLIASMFFSGWTGIANAGFGISPPSLTNKNLVPGSFYEQDVFLVQGTPDQTLHATVKVDAGEINSWIKIENGNTFDIPKGTQQFPMKIDVSVPSNAALKEYKGKITVSTLPDASSNSGVQITLGAEITIDLSVTSIKVSNFSIQNFSIPDVKKGSPIKFIVKVKNEGNTDNGPTKVGLTFFDQYHVTQLGQQEENVTETVKSFQTKDLSVDFPNNLDAGQYWADVKIYSGDKVAVDSKIVFNVVSRLAAKKPVVFKLPNFSAIPVWVYLLVSAVIIILVLVAIIILILFKTKRHHAKKKKASEDKNEYIKKLKIHDDKK